MPTWRGSGTWWVDRTGGAGDTLGEGEVLWGDALHSPGGGPQILPLILP